MDIAVLDDQIFGIMSIVFFVAIMLIGLWVAWQECLKQPGARAFIIMITVLVEILLVSEINFSFYQHFGRHLFPEMFLWVSLASCLILAMAIVIYILISGFQRRKG